VALLEERGERLVGAYIVCVWRGRRAKMAVKGQGFEPLVALHLRYLCNDTPCVDAVLKGG